MPISSEPRRRGFEFRGEQLTTQREPAGQLPDAFVTGEQIVHLADSIPKADYIVEGGSSKNYVQTKSLMYNDSGAWHAMMSLISRYSAGTPSSTKVRTAQSSSRA